MPRGEREAEMLNYVAEVCGRDPLYKIGRNGKYQCPCCRYFTLGSYNQWDICQVCFWEDEGCMSDDEWAGSSGMTLGEARVAYREFGICCPDHSNIAEIRKLIRPPNHDEIELGELAIAGEENHAKG